MKKIVILIAFVLISLSSFSQIRWTTQYYNPEFKWVKIDSGLWINVYGKFYLPALAQGGAAVLQTNTSGQVGNIPITASLPLSIDFTGTSINTSMTQVGGASNGWMSSYQWNSISAQAGQCTTCTSGIYRNSGNVGIGTTNPQYPLDVNGQSNHLELSATYSFDVMNGFIEFPFWQTGNLAGNTLTLDESFNIIYTGNSAKILTGFLNSVNPINVHGDGRVVRIWGSSNTNTLTIPKTMTGTLNIPYDIVLKQGDWVELTYNYILNKWLFTGSGGQTSYDNNKTVNGTLSNPHITKNDTATKYVSVNPYDGKFSYNNPNFIIFSDTSTKIGTKHDLLSKIAYADTSTKIETKHDIKPLSNTGWHYANCGIILQPLFCPPDTTTYLNWNNQCVVTLPSCLTTFTGMKYFNVSQNNIYNAPNVTMYPNLSYYNISNNPITSYSDLSYCTNLKTTIFDETYLSTAPQIPNSVIYFSSAYNSYDDTTSLYLKSNLKHFDISNNPVITKQHKLKYNTNLITINEDGCFLLATNPDVTNCSLLDTLSLRSLNNSVRTLRIAVNISGNPNLIYWDISDQITVTTAVVNSNNVNLTYININGNALPRPVVNAILAQVETNGLTAASCSCTPYLDLGGGINAVPTGGITNASYLSLIAKGWTVNINP